jgi:hypothetical protein
MLDSALLRFLISSYFSLSKYKSSAIIDSSYFDSNLEC